MVIEVLKFYLDRGDLEGDRRLENSLYAKGGGYAHWVRVHIRVGEGLIVCKISAHTKPMTP